MKMWKLSHQEHMVGLPLFLLWDNTYSKIKDVSCTLSCLTSLTCSISRNTRRSIQSTSAISPCLYLFTNCYKCKKHHARVVHNYLHSTQVRWLYNGAFKQCYSLSSALPSHCPSVSLGLCLQQSHPPLCPSTLSGHETLGVSNCKYICYNSIINLTCFETSRLL